VQMQLRLGKTADEVANVIHLSSLRGEVAERG
jgi:hypothetical protein